MFGTGFQVIHRDKKGEAATTHGGNGTQSTWKEEQGQQSRSSLPVATGGE